MQQEKVRDRERRDPLAEVAPGRLSCSWGAAGRMTRSRDPPAILLRRPGPKRPAGRAMSFATKCERIRDTSVGRRNKNKSPFFLQVYCCAPDFFMRLSAGHFFASCFFLSVFNRHFQHFSTFFFIFQMPTEHCNKCSIL